MTALIPILDDKCIACDQTESTAPFKNQLGFSIFLCPLCAHLIYLKFREFPIKFDNPYKLGRLGKK